MARLRCRSCNYVFEPKARIPSICPYCSAEGNLFEEKSILDEINMDDDEKMV